MSGFLLQPQCQRRRAVSDQVEQQQLDRSSAALVDRPTWLREDYQDFSPTLHDNR